MGVEIERKFLLKNHDWRTHATGSIYRQGYLNSEKGRTVRVRTIGEKGLLTIKGPAVDGVRLEFEYEIPLVDAEEMLNRLCHKPLIEKIRYKLQYHGFVWEIDEFKGENAGLILAEVELNAPDQRFDLPPWIATEVTGDPRYYNANLVRNPFCRWRKS
jgi:adenylate cyclase